MKIVQSRSDHGKLAAGHDKTLLVHDADGSVHRVLHLNDHILKYSAGHILSLPFCRITAPPSPIGRARRIALFPIACVSGSF
jgi:hypothetical protein